MKVVAINGSPHVNGSTDRMLKRALARLRQRGIEGEQIDLRRKRLLPCLRCGSCRIMRNGFCTIEDDEFALLFKAMRKADLLLFGAPVDRGAAVPGLKALLERSARVSRANGNVFDRKPGAVIAVVHHRVSKHTLTRLLAWLQTQGLIVPGALGSRSGLKPEAVAIRDDPAGEQAVDRLADNLAWLAEKLGGQTPPPPVTDA
jgi:multimeric flavodoxin WrbA